MASTAALQAMVAVLNEPPAQLSAETVDIEDQRREAGNRGPGWGKRPPWKDNIRSFAMPMPTRRCFMLAPLSCN